jgi:hypothetical protein
MKLLDNFDWTVITDSEAVVHHDSIDAHLRDNELHHRLRMRDRVVHEAIQVRARSLGGMFGCRDDIPTVIETAQLPHVLR